MTPQRHAATTVVMAKTPVAGAVKTRLAADVGDDLAVAAALALLQDTVANAAAVGPVVVAVAGDIDGISALLPAGTSVIPQVGADLAERLTRAQLATFAGGARRVLLLGADCPTVGPDLIARAVAALDRAPAAMVPAVDGGYALLGTTAPTPQLFTGIRMGGPDVADRTRAAAQRASIGLVELPVRHDLDRAADFAAALLAGELAHAPRTRALAQRLALRVTG
ncbi:MAG TPA: TIGR04282 family arsenosugar biosynthesis glycosyltransferase [Euzebya sp.]|nr:TIGR04282 family arsenosugar biosynthesis glycosyltransferase [Euzebya sp.]